MKTGYLVADVMTERPVTLTSEDSLIECAKTMKSEHVGAVLVKDDGEIKGIITEQDMVRKAIALEKNPLKLKIEEIMSSDMMTIQGDLDIFEALTKMKNLNIRHLPVMSNKKFVGLLTLKDILRIEPQLFELMVDKFELRESERKPIPSLDGKAGICNICAEYADVVHEVDGVLMCDKCKKEH